MKKLFTYKKSLITLILIIVAGAYLVTSGGSDVTDEIEIGVVNRGEIKKVVSETGFVQPSREVSMAFERGGRVVSIPVQVGVVVEEGKTLLELDTAERKVELSAAYARLQAEQVRLKELISGADSVSLGVSGSAVDSAATALENTKTILAKVTAQQNQLVVNAEKNLRSTGLAAYLVSDERESSSYSYAAPIISGTYNSDEEGIYRIELFNSGAQSGSSFRVTGLETATEVVSTVNPTPIGVRGLYIQFPANFANRTEWEIAIPNTRSSSYLANLNAYNSALEARDVAIKGAESSVKSAEAALVQSQQQYTQVSSSARDERVDAQQAMVNQMYASVQASEIALDKMTIRAPFAGVVTNIFAEVGEIVSPTVPVVSLISDENFELVVNISESDIQEITIDDTAKVIFDAYDDAIFDAKVVRIAPTAEIIEGVRAFEVALKFIEKDDRIRAGLSADIDILAEKKSNVITVPTRAVVEREDGKFLRTWDGSELGYISVQTGLRGSDGMTEITSGLEEGAEIITFAREEVIQLLEKN